jgi:hypothetical protein
MDVTPAPPLTMAPLLAALYQSIVLPPAYALKVTVPAPHRELLLALVGVGGESSLTAYVPVICTAQYVPFSFTRAA